MRLIAQGVAAATFAIEVGVEDGNLLLKLRLRDLPGDISRRTIADNESRGYDDGGWHDVERLERSICFQQVAIAFGALGHLFGYLIIHTAKFHRFMPLMSQAKVTFNCHQC